MNLDIYDSRLGGVAPGNAAHKVTMTVDQTTPLAQLLTRVRVDALAYSDKIEVLRILAHGSNNYLQFCKDGLRPHNVFTQFGRLSELLDKDSLVVLQGCAVVYYAGPGIGMTSALMKNLAWSCKSHVMGSSATEYYNRSDMDFGPWEGNLHLCSPSGTWYRLGSRVRRREMIYHKFAFELRTAAVQVGEWFSDRLLWRIWSAMLPEGRTRGWYG
jgi:hypothetical protein